MIDCLVKSASASEDVICEYFPGMTFHNKRFQVTVYTF